MKTLTITKGYRLDTPTGHQIVVAQHGPTSYTVHNYDEDGTYTGVTILTDREILRYHHDCTDEWCNTVLYNPLLWYAVMRDREDDWGTGSYDLAEAEDMLRNIRTDYPAAMIAVIDNSVDNPVCVDEITDI